MVSKYKPHQIWCGFFIFIKKALVRFLKLLIRAALFIFCKKVHIQNKGLLSNKGPLLIIANHPNSFLDAIILGAYYKRRVYFLARGDVFKKRQYRILLHGLNMIPVYRLREGKENLHLNSYAFKKSIELLSKGEALLVFIEGTCINDHTLQPFKKGTARILEGLYAINIFPTIHIAGIAYNHLMGIGKSINIKISPFPFNYKLINAADRVLFNKQVFNILQQNIIIPSDQHKTKRNLLYYLHLPYYKMLYKFVFKITKGTVFFDSVLFCFLLFSYPIFLLLIFILLSQLKISLPIIFIILLCIPILSKKSIF